MILMVLNVGSSSVKFTLFDMRGQNADLLARGLIERIGLAGTAVTYADHKDRRLEKEIEVPDAKAAVRYISGLITSPDYGVVKSLTEIQAIGHRVAHGLDQITKAVLVDDEVKNVIRESFTLAPLHAPVHMAGIEACEAALPGLPNVAVFDTAFHSTMPPEAYLYAIPYDLCREHKIRRYGFHGTSCAYVLPQALTLTGADPKTARVIVCHLGSGATVTAIAGGQSQENSMGLTPLEGLVMGTRSGDIDPGAMIHIMKARGLKEVSELDALLNKQSGLLGLAGIGSPDLRDVEKAADQGHEQCAQALAVYARRIKKYIGAYMAVLGGLDILIFTAGVGENSVTMRRRVCRGLEGLGIELDEVRNDRRFSAPGLISTEASPVKIAVVPTDEEREIANQTLAVIKKM